MLCVTSTHLTSSSNVPHARRLVGGARDHMSIIQCEGCPPHVVGVSHKSRKERHVCTLCRAPTTPTSPQLRRVEGHALRQLRACAVKRYKICEQKPQPPLCHVTEQRGADCARPDYSVSREAVLQVVLFYSTASYSSYPCTQQPKVMQSSGAVWPYRPLSCHVISKHQTYWSLFRRQRTKEARTELPGGT